MSEAELEAYTRHIQELRGSPQTAAAQLAPTKKTREKKVTSNILQLLGIQT
jgi:hypothetical protein